MDSDNEDDGLLPLEANRYRTQEEVDKLNFEKFEAAAQKKEKEKRKAKKLEKKKEKEKKKLKKEKKKQKAEKNKQWKEKPVASPKDSMSLEQPEGQEQQALERPQHSADPPTPGAPTEAPQDRMEWMVKPPPRTVLPGLDPAADSETKKKRN